MASGPSDTPENICGLIMPISAIDGCPEQHWMDVRVILEEAIRRAKFTPKLVSDADDVGIIQKRIVQNLFDNPMVVCDVSAKNPNVMFELGLRLAFDKPAIIVKDDYTNYSFDTAQIEHLIYPRDLRHNKILDFVQSLSEKISSTYEAAKQPEFTTFLKHFDKVRVTTLETTDIPFNQYLVDQILEIKRVIEEKHAPNLHDRASDRVVSPGERSLQLLGWPPEIQSLIPKSELIRMQLLLSRRQGEIPESELVAQLLSDDTLQQIVRFYASSTPRLAQVQLAQLLLDKLTRISVNITRSTALITALFHLSGTFSANSAES